MYNPQCGTACCLVHRKQQWGPLQSLMPAVWLQIRPSLTVEGQTAPHPTPPCPSTSLEVSALSSRTMAASALPRSQPGPLSGSQPTVTECWPSWTQQPRCGNGIATSTARLSLETRCTSLGSWRVPTRRATLQALHPQLGRRLPPLAELEIPNHKALRNSLVYKQWSQSHCSRAECLSLKYLRPGQSQSFWLLQHAGICYNFDSMQQLS